MFSLPDLPYDYSALEPFIDTETMHFHHDKHHAAYVKNLNDALAGYEDLQKMDVEDLLRHLTKVPKEIRTKVKNNGGGHANHSLFWTIMSANPKSETRNPEGKLMEAIKNSFGDFHTFKEKFSAVGLGRFGSGWVFLIPVGDKLEIVDTANQDTPVSESKNPVLILDVWEHAYYLKYKNMRADYITAWWNVVNWKKVEKLFVESNS
jgi:superoxide dismutase, Fe-Mn family